MKLTDYLRKFDAWAEVFVGSEFYAESDFMVSYTYIRNLVSTFSFPNEAEPDEFCKILYDGLSSIQKGNSVVAQHWGRIQIPIAKSNCLARLIYGDEELRTVPCPTHKGHWSGMDWDEPCECAWGGNLTGWLPNE